MFSTDSSFSFFYLLLPLPEPFSTGEAALGAALLPLVAFGPGPVAFPFCF